MSNFAALGLSKPLIDAIEKMGFENPTPIKQKAIPELLKDATDLVGLAQTGTGKTAAFGLPLIDLVDSNTKKTQALVLAPTRELCVQISKELVSFSKNHHDLKILAVYGGTDIAKQMRDIRKGVHIVVATPGRLRDLIRRKAINVTEIDYVILDEADEMLNMGFKEEIDDILENTPEDKLTWLFSATMPQEVRRIAKTYMTEPLELTVGDRNTANLDIEHQYVITKPRIRYETLKRFLDFDTDTFGLVFTRTRRDANDVAEMLSKDGYNADALHGDMNQSQRDRVMAKFRDRRLQILVATDVAARGIDVQEITHVFHYNIPDDISFYTHRAGRTGRAGKKGVSIVLAHPKDLGLLRQVERKVKIKFELAHIPTGREICEKRLLMQMRRIKDIEPIEAIDSFLPAIQEELVDLSKEELIERVATLSFSRYYKAYRRAPDLNQKSPAQKRKERFERDVQYKKLFINIGMIDVDGKGGLLAFICGKTNLPGSIIGRINLSRKHTFFDVEEEYAQQIINKLDGLSIEGRSIRVNIDGEAHGGKRQKKRDKRKKRFKSKT